MRFLTFVKGLSHLGRECRDLGSIPKRLEVAGITQAVIPEVFYRESSGMTGFLLRACRNDET